MNQGKSFTKRKTTWWHEKSDRGNFFVELSSRRQWEQECCRWWREAGLAKMSQSVNQEGEVHNCWQYPCHQRDSRNIGNTNYLNFWRGFEWSTILRHFLHSSRGNCYLSRKSALYPISIPRARGFQRVLSVFAEAPAKVDVGFSGHCSDIQAHNHRDGQERFFLSDFLFG
jgi:hypothetical protein